MGLYNTICQEGWDNSRPFGSAHCIGAPLPNGLLSPPAALPSEASKRSCRELSPGPRRVPCFHISTCFVFFCIFWIFSFSIRLFFPVRHLRRASGGNQTVVVWLQQLKPEWCQLAQKICRACPILWGGPGQHARGYFLTTRRDPRVPKMKPQGKATPSSLQK